jgi:glycosyltransferase involved in cell wall biosynthesis
MGISYDLFWHFAPLTYPESYVNLYDQRLLMWLQKADLILTISQKTRDDILTIFPKDQFENKIKAIPLAGFPSHEVKRSLETSSENLITFYFPSSFGIYKDHLTLLKAGVKLAAKGLNFKIVLLGKETDSLVNGELQLSQQSKTQEYQDYFQECTQLYQENQDIFTQYFAGLGYCEYEQVEHCYETCSCVVAPSQYEGFGLAVSEAIVRGLPVIASDLEVFQEQIDLYQCPDRIELFPQGDADALATCMEHFILNPKQKLSAEEVTERFSHWTWQEVAQKYVELMQRI